MIEDGVIEAVNPKTLPINIKAINKPKLTLLPGLMDMHVHIAFDLNKDYISDFVRTNAADATLIGAKNARVLLMAGFTTIRDLGQIYPGETFVDVALAKASEKGIIEAPHIIPAGHALSITGGHMDPEMVGPYHPGTFKNSYKNGVADGKADVIKAVRYQIKNGAKIIKAAATSGVLSHEKSVGAQQYSYEELKAMVDEAARHDIFVSVHAHGTEGIKSAIRAGVRSIEHGSMLDDEAISLMKEHGTFLVPTTYLTEGLDLSVIQPDLRQKAIKVFPLARANLTKAIKANVKIAFGTDTPVFPHGQNAKEFNALVQRGMTPLQAIQTSTINAAELMQIEDRGTLKVGMLADIIGVQGDPIQNITILESVPFVMKAGKVYKE